MRKMGSESVLRRWWVGDRQVWLWLACHVTECRLNQSGGTLKWCVCASDAIKKKVFRPFSVLHEGTRGFVVQQGPSDWLPNQPMCSCSALFLSSFGDLAGGSLPLLLRS